MSHIQTMNKDNGLLIIITSITFCVGTRRSKAGYLVPLEHEALIGRKSRLTII